MYICDLDGCVFNFVKASYELHNRPYVFDEKIRYDYWHDWYDADGLPMSNTEFWGKIDAAGPDFWANIEPYEWTEELIATLVDAASKDNVPFFIATSPSKHAYSTAGKVASIQKLLGVDFRNYNITPCKWCMSGPDRVLIDDFKSNCDAFEDEKNGGGRAFLFPQPWNTDHYNIDRIQALKDWL